MESSHSTYGAEDATSPTIAIPKTPFQIPYSYGFLNQFDMNYMMGARNVCLDEISHSPYKRALISHAAIQTNDCIILVESWTAD